MIPRGNCRWKVTAVILCLSSLTVSTQGAIQCYCNRDECRDSYTCISHTEKCYSKLYTVYTHENQMGQSSKDEHGCIDLVHSESRDSTLCDSAGDVVKQLKELEPLIMCCSDNMCNYRKNQDIRVDIINSPVVSKDDEMQEQESILPIKEAEVQPSTDNEDIIFRAAVIAVPIAGGLILVILILMAVRMLREDYRRSDSQHRLLKAHTFIEQHFVRKDDKSIRKDERKNSSRSKKTYSKNIQIGCDSTPVHHKPVQLPHTQQSVTNEHLISKHTDHNNSAADDKSNVCVSLLPSGKQSDICIV